jgi:hypothetical protein
MPSMFFVRFNNVSRTSAVLAINFNFLIATVLVGSASFGAAVGVAVDASVATGAAGFVGSAGFGATVGTWVGVGELHAVNKNMRPTLAMNWLFIRVYLY